MGHVGYRSTAHLRRCWKMSQWHAYLTFDQLPRLSALTASGERFTLAISGRMSSQESVRTTSTMLPRSVWSTTPRTGRRMPSSRQLNGAGPALSLLGVYLFVCFRCPMESCTLLVLGCQYGIQIYDWDGRNIIYDFDFMKHGIGSDDKEVKQISKLVSGSDFTL